MATFYFNQRKTKEIKKHIALAPLGSTVYFQPTHHGGCVQVLRIIDKKLMQTDYLENTFCGQRSGYQRFIEQIGIHNAALLLDDKWVDAVMTSRTLQFNVHKCKGKLAYKLITKITKNNQQNVC